MENFSGTYFDVRLAIKGRIQPFLAMNSWLTCVHWCRIESTMQENHEELKIFLINHLISARFNQELVYKGRRTSFYRKFLAKNAGRPIRWRMLHSLRLHIFYGPRPHVSWFFTRPIFIGASMCIHVSPPRSIEYLINRNCLISLNWRLRIHHLRQSWSGGSASTRSTCVDFCALIWRVSSGHVTCKT